MKVVYKMKQKVKTKWLEALRSGEYQQCKGQLKLGNSFCCLGVLTDVYIKASQEQFGSWNDDTYVEDDAKFSEVLPDSVVTWAGLCSDNPKIGYSDGEITHLSSLNDGRLSPSSGVRFIKSHTFLEIADLIEKGL